MDGKLLVPDIKIPPFQIFKYFFRILEPTGYEKTGETIKKDQFKMSYFSDVVKCAMQGSKLLINVLVKQI